jgi:SAM-dependent methyltransferase
VRRINDPLEGRMMDATKTNANADTTTNTTACNPPECCTAECRDNPECCASESAPSATDAVRETVKARYGQAVQAVIRGATSSCCGASTAPGIGGTDPITRNLYSADQTDGLPGDAVLASFGCGNPTALAELRAGEIVLDLGAGGGIDVLLSAKRVGPTGKAYGLDMTDEMLDLARKNAGAAGAANVEFLKGHIEAIPLPDASVDVIISNCVINLSTDKDQVLREACRVLRSGGRFAVSDIVIRRALTEPVKRSMALWTGCISGALEEHEYRAKLEAAGFSGVEIEPTRIYSRDDTAEMANAAESDQDVEATLHALDGAVMSAFIRAQKPA